jgi:hypothetical protein
MELKHGKRYRAPDGRIFTAKAEIRHFASGLVWTFIPPDVKTGASWRDSLEHFLFFENGKIGYFDFSGFVPIFVDTYWTPKDFVEVVIEAADTMSEPASATEA